MSTDLYLRCVSHKPYIQSDEVGRYSGSLLSIRSDIAERDTICKMMDDLWERDSDMHMWGTYQTNTYWFLWRHPKCDLEIWDEYGRQYSLTEEPIPVSHFTRLNDGQTVCFNSDADQDFIIGGIGPLKACPNCIAIIQKWWWE